MAQFHQSVTNRQYTLNGLTDFTIDDSGNIRTVYATKQSQDLGQLTAYGFAKSVGYTGTLEQFLNDCKNSKSNMYTAKSYWDQVQTIIYKTINGIRVKDTPVSYAVDQKMNEQQKETARNNVNAMQQSIVSQDYIDEFMNITKEG